MSDNILEVSHLKKYFKTRQGMVHAVDDVSFTLGRGKTLGVVGLGAIGILVAVLNQVLVKAGREDMAMLTTLAGLVIVLMMVVNLIGNLFTDVRSVFRLY